MEIKYKDGALHIDLHSLFDTLKEQCSSEFLESISCNSKVIKHVTSQILDKWTENGYSNGSFVTASAAPCHGLDLAWREVAKRSGEVAKREIERLEAALKERDKQYYDLLEELCSVRRGLNC